MVEHVTYPILGYVRTHLIFGCILVAANVVTVGVRVVSRISGPGLGWDDGLILVGMPMGVALLVCQGLYSTAAEGYSMIERPEVGLDVPYIYLVTFYLQIFYVCALASAKASCCCFYIRIFVGSGVRRASKLTLCMVTVWFIGFLGSSIFLCRPISAQWTGEGTCADHVMMLQSMVSTSILTDLVIMALPMYSIWKLQMQFWDKIAVMSCFGLGLVVVIVSLLRLIYIGTIDVQDNVTGTSASTILLITLEANMALLCVSLPTLRIFFSRCRTRNKSSKLPGGQPPSTQRNSKTMPLGASFPRPMLDSSRDLNPVDEGVAGSEMDDYDERHSQKRKHSSVDMADHADIPGRTCDTVYVVVKS